MLRLFILFTLIFGVIACSSKPDLEYGPATEVSLADQDADGVIDARDLCDKTIKGAEVDNNGCPSKSTTVLTLNLNILFDNDSYIVKPQFNDELIQLAEMINQTKAIKLELEGHASALGSEAYNLNLSLLRAKEVMRILIDKYQVDRTKLEAIPFGESKLAVEGTSEAQHSLNRRVVAYIEISNQKDLLRWNIYTSEKQLEGTN